jgi:hypothetical protein
MKWFLRYMWELWNWAFGRFAPYQRFIGLISIVVSLAGATLWNKYVGVTLLLLLAFFFFFVAPAYLWHLRDKELDDLKLRVRTLEGDLKAEKAGNEFTKSPFTLPEQSDFRFIWQRLDRSIACKIFEGPPDETGRKYVTTAIHLLQVNLASIICGVIGTNTPTYEHYHLVRQVVRRFAEITKKDIKNLRLFDLYDPVNELITFQLIETVYVQVKPELGWLGGKYEYPFTQKAHRLKYWLEYTGDFPDEIQITEIKSK